MKPGAAGGVECQVRLQFQPNRGRRGIRSVALLVAFAASCHGASGGDGSSLGPPDSYLVFEAVAPGSAPAPAPSASGPSTGAAPAPRLLRAVAIDDPRALPVHRLALEGFLGEILRTDYLAKQLVREGLGGRAFSAEARAEASEPTVLVLSGSRTTSAAAAAFGRGFETPGLFGGRTSYPSPTWIDIGADPVTDPAFVQTATARVARLVAERLTRAAGTVPAMAPNPAASLVDGYAMAMEVIAREWRVGEGPNGTLPPDAGTGTQRERFAAVRQNAYVFEPDQPRALRPGNAMISEPGVVAAVIYRMAQVKGIGRRVAPKELYGALATARVPEGVSPAAVLGPVRNFQAKLLTAWGRAILEGHPPRDLVDLVVAYARALPDEKNEVYRVFVATTYGATVRAGGVSARPQDIAASTAELATLGAEVAAGRRSPRAGIAGAASPP